MQKILVWIVAVVVLGIGTYVFLNPGSSKEVMMEGEGVMTPKDSELPTGQVEKGAYEAYAPEKLALAGKGKVVLYFHADWCPICRGLERDISANTIPAGVHILKVDYGTATSLKQKYGVTYQHTFVQVDVNGTQITKWGDATTLAQVLARVK
jgi:thiol-disulfide isomerase/thioredoxin